MSSAGLLVIDKGLPRGLLAPSALGALPPITPFVEPLPIPPVLPQRAVSELNPAPTNDLNRAINWNNLEDPDGIKETLVNVDAL